jgi:hypothetical protein
VNAYLGLGLEGLGTYEPIDTASAYKKPYEVVLGEALDVMRRKSVMSKWLPIMHVVGDEPMGEAIGKSLALAKAFRAADPKARTSVFTSFTDPDKDERAAFAGAVDRLYLNHHSTAAIDHIRSKGGECTLYNQSGRYWRGIYLLKLRQSGCRGHMQFAFSSVHADPWYDLDGREADYVAVHAHRDGSLRPDIDFLRYREAVTDYRHLLKLEQSIKSAPEGAAREAAAQWLSGVLARMEIGTGKTAPWRDEEIDAVRQQAAAHISALGGGS